MKNTDSKPLSYIIFIPLLSLIFLRPFFSGLAYPVFESYYEIFIIFLAIAVIVSRKEGLNLPSGYILPILLLLSACIISTIFYQHSKFYQRDNQIYKLYFYFLHCIANQQLSEKYLDKNHCNCSYNNKRLLNISILLGLPAYYRLFKKIEQ
jgi:hypothetical protein